MVTEGRSPSVQERLDLFCSGHLQSACYRSIFTQHDYTSVALSLSAFIKMEFLKLPFIFLTGVPSIDLGAGCNSRPLNDSALGHSSWMALR